MATLLAPILSLCYYRGCVILDGPKKTMPDKDREIPTTDEIKEILREVAEEQRDISRKQAETDKQLKETAKMTEEAAEARKDLARRQAETDKQLKETAKMTEEAAEARKDLARRQAETDKQLKETAKMTEEAAEARKDLARRQAETDKQLRKVGRQIGGIGNRWGKIAESLVAGDLATILKERLQVKIHYAGKNLKGDGWEIDVLAVNAGVAVPTEVKVTLNRGDIDHFISRVLCRFTELMPEHKGKKIYGVIAFVKIDGNEQEVIAYAQSKGLIVIRIIGGTSKILNPEGFKFRNFHP